MTDRQRVLISETFYRALRDGLRAFDDQRDNATPQEVQGMLDDLRLLEDAIVELGYKDAVSRYTSKFVLTR
jgi:hypothetical protein